MTAPFPRFDAPVPPDGYRWWYVDAISPDGEQALTLIAFVGSVFSPWYASARRRGPADPAAHCTMNAILYGRRAKRWAFTERPARKISRSADQFSIGPSRVSRVGDALVFEIDEITVPVPTRLRGTVRVTPEFVIDTVYPLDTQGLHHWRPIAPRARVDVELARPAERWSGHGYLDSNWGEDSLERAFIGWNWSRNDLGTAASAETAILYDAVRRDGTRHSLGLRFDRSGTAESFEPPGEVVLARTKWWRVERRTRSEGDARVIRTLEDTPFYARSMVETRLLGGRSVGVHESLSLTRFASTWVQCLLPFRAPRR